MQPERNTVVPAMKLPSEPEFSAQLVLGLARASAKLGRGALADRSGRTGRGLDKLFAGSIPNGKGLLDLLTADLSVLDEVLALYGLRVVPIEHEAAADLSLLADATGLVAEHIDAMRDGRRDHQETLRIAEKARPVLRQYACIIEEADRLRRSP